MMQVHHRNLRLWTTEEVRRHDDLTIQFSAVHSLSRHDLKTLAAEVQRLIDRSREIVAPSKEEEAVIVTLDLCPA